MRFKLLFFMLLILFSFSFTIYSQQEMVRMVYFYPKDRAIDQAAIQTKMNGLAKILVSFYEGLVFEKTNNEYVVHFVQGDHNASDYISRRGILDIIDPEPTEWILSEIREKKDFDMSKNLYLVVTNVDNPNDICGVGGIVIKPDLGDRLLLRQKIEGAWAIVYDTSVCSSELIYFFAAHELGHAFGLLHDFSNRNYIMSYGMEEVQYPNDVAIWRTPYELSDCSKSWLKASRFFDLDPSLSRATPPGKIEVSSTHYYPTTQELHLSLTGTGVPALHQVHLYLIPMNVPIGFFPGDPSRNERWSTLGNHNKYSLHSYRKFGITQINRKKIVF